MNLIDALDAPSAEAWIPEAKGDLIVGLIVSEGEWDAGYGPYPILTFEVEQATVDGKPVQAHTLAVHCLGTVLANKVKEKGLATGWRAAIRFEGEKESKSIDPKTKKHNTYKNWTVAGEPPKPGADLVRKLTDDEAPF